MSDTMSASPHQWAMHTEPQGWGEIHLLETSFTGLSANAFHLTFAKSHHLSWVISVFVGQKPLPKLLVFYWRDFLQYLEEGTRKHDTSVAKSVNQGWAVMVYQLSYLGAQWGTVGRCTLDFLWRTSRYRGKWFKVQFSPSKRAGTWQECT